MNRNTMTNEDAGIRVSAQLQHQDERPVEEWSSAGIGNAFLFGKVMTANPDLLLELLFTFLRLCLVLGLQGCQILCRLGILGHFLQDLLVADIAELDLCLAGDAEQ